MAKSASTLILPALSIPVVVPSPAKLKPKVPPELDAIVQKMGAKDPHLRYQSARAVVTALQAWLPVAQWQALGLSTAARTAPAAPPPASAQRGAKPAAPAKPGGFRAFLRRLFSR